MPANNFKLRKVIFFIKSPVQDMMSKLDMTDNDKKLFGDEWAITTDEQFDSIVRKISGTKDIGYVIDGDNKWENELYNIYSNGTTFRFRGRL